MPLLSDSGKSLFPAVCISGDVTEGLLMTDIKRVESVRGDKSVSDLFHIACRIKKVPHISESKPK